MTAFFLNSFKMVIIQRQCKSVSLKTKPSGWARAGRTGHSGSRPQEGGRLAKASLQDREAWVRCWLRASRGRDPTEAPPALTAPAPQPPGRVRPHCRLLRTDGQQRIHSDQARQPLSLTRTWLHSRMRKTRATGPISSPRFITERLCGADTKHAEPLLGAPAFKRFL